jgi:MoaA/NifB/PqqE/SkfB family radical SAM enzyme
MEISTLVKLGFKHTTNASAEAVYLKTGYDITKPISFYGLVNERCNVKCLHCEYWRIKHYEEELSIEQWQATLLSIKAFVGTYFINFSGGEPFIKKGFFDLLDFCHQNGIRSGVTTNGSGLSRSGAEKVVAAHPFNVNISCDGPNAQVHDYFRGSVGLFDKLSQGITFLLEEQAAQGIDFPIVIKPTINSVNFRLLPELVEWTDKIGATAINFQPLDRWTPETYNELWIEEQSWPELEQIIERLIQMKRAGAPIMNSEENLGLTVANFREEKAPPELKPCLVGLRNFFIRTNGDVSLCLNYPPIGNVKEQSAQQIWYGEKAQKIRKQTTECNQLCLSTALSQKSLSDKFKMGLKLLNTKRAVH